MKREEILRTVRGIVGSQSSPISREQMRAILIALAIGGLDLRNSSVPETWHLLPNGHADEGPQKPEQIQRAARVWANACKDIDVISVKPTGAIPHGEVRYDQPGQMAPKQRAVIMFVPAELQRHPHDQVGQLRRLARRVLIVSSDPQLAEKENPQLAA